MDRGGMRSARARRACAPPCTALSLPRLASAGPDPRPCLSVLLLLLLATLPTGAAQNPIRLNSIGFLPDQAKQASVAVAGTNFAVLRQLDGAVVFTGCLTGPFTNSDTAETLFTADFSTLREPGGYQLDVPGAGRSPAFRIGAEVYRPPYVAVMRAFYLWRCGTAVHATIEGQTYAHAACHPVTHGWISPPGSTSFDPPSAAGTTRAITTNTSSTRASRVGALLRAWEDFGAHLAGIPLDLPEAGGRLPGVSGGNQMGAGLAADDAGPGRLGVPQGFHAAFRSVHPTRAGNRAPLFRAVEQ